eukprot:scaffold346_cov347-Pavlova_lutheri.AAC.31
MLATFMLSSSAAMLQRNLFHIAPLRRSKASVPTSDARKATTTARLHRSVERRITCSGSISRWRVMWRQ